MPPTAASYLNFRAVGATDSFFSSGTRVKVVDCRVLSDGFIPTEAPAVFRPSLGLPSVACVRSPWPVWAAEPLRSGVWCFEQPTRGQYNLPEQQFSFSSKRTEIRQIAFQRELLNFWVSHSEDFFCWCLFILSCVYVWGMCTCVFAYVLVDMCAGMYACLQTCMWGPKGDVRNLPRLLHLTHWGRVCRSNPEPSGKAALNSQFALGILCLSLHRLELQTCYHAHQVFLWMLHIWTLILLCVCSKRFNHWPPH